MNGAESVLRTLAASGVEVCFANPGTSEMHLVAAMDRVPEVRGVLTLFEGVASAAADGYARMAEIPAATLLHLGPGFGNAFANVHNAYKGRTPMVNLVGDHAVAHKPLGAPLASRHRGDRAARLALAAHRARRALGGDADRRGRRGGARRRRRDADPARRRGLGREPRRRRRRGRCAPRPPVPDEAVEAAARPCARAAAALLLGGATTREPGLRAAARIAAGTGAEVFHDTFTPRLERGGARPRARLLPYLTELARRRAARTSTSWSIVGTRPPVGFFAYPGMPSLLRTRRRRSRCWRRRRRIRVGALEALADLRRRQPRPSVAPLRARRRCPTGGALDLAHAAPPRSPRCCPTTRSSSTRPSPPPRFFQDRTAGAGEHDYLYLTGGAIGWGLPAATGAAIGAPGRPVCAWRRTAPPCTRSRRCGRRPGRSST